MPTASAWSSPPGQRGQRFREHVRGTDLVHRLDALGATRGHRWYLLSADGVARKAADRLQARYPGLTIAAAAGLATSGRRRRYLGRDPRGRRST